MQSIRKEFFDLKDTCFNFSKENYHFWKGRVMHIFYSLYHIYTMSCQKNTKTEKHFQETVYCVLRCVDNIP